VLVEDAAAAAAELVVTLWNPLEVGAAELLAAVAMVPAPAFADEEPYTGDEDEAPAGAPADDGAVFPDAEEKSPIPLTCLQVPVTPPGTFVISVTSGPGSGNVVSLLSIVVQPFPRFATNRDGREAKEVPARLALPDPVMVTDAQFMYISLLPI
jgi:hypothetical protein